MLADPWKEVHQGLDEGFDCSTQLAAQEGSPIAYGGLAGSEKDLSVNIRVSSSPDISHNQPVLSGVSNTVERSSAVDCRLQSIACVFTKLLGHVLQTLRIPAKLGSLNIIHEMIGNLLSAVGWRG